MKHPEYKNATLATKTARIAMDQHKTIVSNALVRISSSKLSRNVWSLKDVPKATMKTETRNANHATSIVLHALTHPPSAQNASPNISSSTKV